ncbi:MAG: glutamate--tRNA ligase [Thiotrichaceae bacterium]|nr:glutamate--tRNA ligase [Thiotrichaceae bacterium]
MTNPPIKTRFAPSPTGFMHLGNARTALFNALFAYQMGGVFLLRIEDTDIERSTDEFAQQLMQDLRWLGLDWQEGASVGGSGEPYYQAQRGEIYAKYYNELSENKLAYPCFCTPAELELSRKVQRLSGQAPRYAGTCAHLSPADVEKKLAQGLKPTLRFRVPRGEKVQFPDIVRGMQTFDSDDLGDFIIRRGDGGSAFFFCNAIDDSLMNVSHVLRGEDHLTNTPRQILILQALKLKIPSYGHISMILGNDGTPLSKRNGSQGIKDLKEKGWRAESVVNYLARLGHAYTEEKGFLPLADLARDFSLERLGKAPARYDENQLRHWQSEAMLTCQASELWEGMGEEVYQLVPAVQKDAFISAVRANILFPQDALAWAKMLFTDELHYSDEAREVTANAGKAFFEHALVALENSQADYKQLIEQLKQSAGVKGKALFMPLRAALTGETHGPEMANLLPLMGVARARARLQHWA